MCRDEDLYYYEHDRRCLCSEAFEDLPDATEDELQAQKMGDALVASIEHRPSAKEDPRFALFFTSNDVPMAAQAAVVNGILEEHNASLILLEAELAEQHTKLYNAQVTMRSLISRQRVLKAEQEYLTREIDTCRGIVSPVRSLPREIIAEIFLYFAPVLTTGHSFITKPKDDAVRVPRVAIPWQLGQVCREWRTVAVSLHSLWSACDFPSPHSHETRQQTWGASSNPDDILKQTACIERSLASVETRLYRSGPNPISAQVVDHNPAHTMPFVNTLSRHSRRLKSLFLVDPTEETIDLFYESITQYSQLRSLGLASVSSTPSISFVYPSSLTNLSFHSLHLSTANCSCIPWTQLTKYCEIKCSWGGEEANRWSSYANLQNAVDLCVHFIRSVRAPQQPVLLPALRHARLTYPGRQSILPYFDTPMLEGLSYNHPYGAGFELKLPRQLSSLRSLRVCAENCPRFTCNLRHTMMMAPNLSEFFVIVKPPRAFDFVAAL
ncbi:hypothetical protein R3P38DRAFT_2905020, partial [Favolaschia claudopus]